MQPCGAADLAPVEILVEVLKQTHIAERVEPDAAGQHQFVAAGCDDQMRDDVHERVLEHHLRGGGNVEARLRRLPVRDVLDAQHGVRVPHVGKRDRLADDCLERFGIGFTQNVARPIGQIAVDEDAALGREPEDIFQRGVIRIALAVIVAIGGGAHVAALARQPGPAALGG